jgi:hypothetical protein
MLTLPGISGRAIASLLRRLGDSGHVLARPGRTMDIGQLSRSCCYTKPTEVGSLFGILASVPEVEFDDRLHAFFVPYDLLPQSVFELARGGTRSIPVQLLGLLPWYSYWHYISFPWTVVLTVP